MNFLSDLGSAVTQLVHAAGKAAEETFDSIASGTDEAADAAASAATEAAGAAEEGLGSLISSAAFVAGKVHETVEDAATDFAADPLAATSEKFESGAQAIATGFENFSQTQLTALDDAKDRVMNEVRDHGNLARDGLDRMASDVGAELKEFGDEIVGSSDPGDVASILGERGGAAAGAILDLVGGASEGLATGLGKSANLLLDKFGDAAEGIGGRPGSDAKSVLDMAGDAVEAIGTETGSVIGNVFGSAADGAERAGSALGGAADALFDRAGDVAEAAGNKVSAVVGRATDAAGSGADKLAGFGDALVDKFAGAAEAAGGKVGAIVDRTVDAAGDAAAKLGGVADRLAVKAAGAAEATGAKAGAAAGRAADAAADTGQGITSGFKQFGDAALEEAASARQAMAKTLADVMETKNDIVDDVKGLLDAPESSKESLDAASGGGDLALDLLKLRLENPLDDTSTYDDAEAALKQLAHDAVDAAANTAAAIGDAVETAGGAIMDGLKDMIGASNDESSEALQWASDKVRDVQDQKNAVIDNMVEDVNDKETAKAQLDAAAGSPDAGDDGVLEDLTGSARNLFDRIAEGLEDAGQAVTGAAEATSAALDEAAGGAGDGILDGLFDVLKASVEEANQDKEWAAEKMQDAMAAKDDVFDAVSSMFDAVSGGTEKAATALVEDNQDAVGPSLFDQIADGLAEAAETFTAGILGEQEGAGSGNESSASRNTHPGEDPEDSTDAADFGAFLTLVQSADTVKNLVQANAPADFDARISFQSMAFDRTPYERSGPGDEAPGVGSIDFSDTGSGRSLETPNSFDDFLG